MEWTREDGYLISTDKQRLDIDYIYHWLSEQSYWAQGRSRVTVEQSIDHSLCFGLYHGSKQVGFARVVTDLATFGWLCHLAVLAHSSGVPIVAVDIASGVSAGDGEIGGVAVKATHTVTFVRPKVGHVMLPGKAHTGTLHVFDIGISGDNLSPQHFLNLPTLWKASFPIPSFESHKYTRGHSIVVGGEMEYSASPPHYVWDRAAMSALVKK